jgi:DNA-binding response OmpR family regulator
MALKRILFVDDEALLRMAIVPSLEDAGYTVDQAGTGKKAIELFQMHGAEISCAVIDVGLPDLKGDTLIAEFRKQSPGVGIVLATGYGDAMLRQAVGGDSRIKIMAKPYFADDLLSALNAVEVAMAAATPAAETRPIAS